MDIETLTRSSAEIFLFSPLQYCLVWNCLGGLQEQWERNSFIWKRFLLHPRCSDAHLWTSSCNDNSVMEPNIFALYISLLNNPVKGKIVHNDVDDAVIVLARKTYT